MADTNPVSTYLFTLCQILPYRQENIIEKRSMEKHLMFPKYDQTMTQRHENFFFLSKVGRMVKTCKIQTAAASWTHDQRLQRAAYTLCNTTLPPVSVRIPRGHTALTCTCQIRIQGSLPAFPGRSDLTDK